eukprot:SAG31_NODE_2297_length_5987_cov_10.665251_5_plen_33_part_00
MGTRTYETAVRDGSTLNLGVRETAMDSCIGTG